MAGDSPTPPVRPRPEEVEHGLPGFSQFPSNLSSVRSLLLVAGGGAFLFGVVIWLFIRDLAGAGQIVMAIGAAMLAVDLGLSWREAGRAIFGRRGRYGFNTVVIVAAFVAMAVLLNYYLFWLISRPEPIGWLRVDTTATKQFILSDQAITILEGLDERVRANAFFVTDTPEGAAAWQDTRDLLSEFKRRSRGNFDFRLIDPELDPNAAGEYEVTNHPAIAVENVNSRRYEVVEGDSPQNGPQVFDETDITTALLVVNQLRQKGVLFITGHGERDIFDLSDQGDGFGRAVQALLRDNYAVGAATVQELFQLLVQDGGANAPAVVVIAGPELDLIDDDTLAPEEGILRSYMASGGSVLFLLEPESPDSWRDLIGRYGVTLGDVRVVDVASFVAPQPSFLQVTRANGQFIGNHPITQPLDVVYIPGAAFIGSTVTPETVPITPEDGTPFVLPSILAVTTLRSWEEAGEQIEFDIEDDLPGPLPVAVAIEAIAELTQSPTRTEDGTWLATNIVVIGDSDFASNSFFSSAKNGDLLANSVNWLARDFELISARPKTRVFRELVLTKTERDFVRWTGWLLMPVIVGSVGVASWWRRR